MIKGAAKLIGLELADERRPATEAGDADHRIGR
jgi:hypothetical protein